MQDTISRTDAVLDTQPETKSGSQTLVYILLYLLGFVLMVAGAYVMYKEGQSWVPALCIPLGVAIATPGVLAYMYRKYLRKEIEDELREPAERFRKTATNMLDQAIEDVTNRYRDELELLKGALSAGILGVYPSRTEAIRAFIRFVDEEQNEIQIVGSSLRGLLQEFETEYENVARVIRAKKGKARIRFLLTHPIVADLRARQESRNFKDIGREIIGSLKTLILDWEIPPSSIKLYVGTPTCFGIMTAQAMLLNPYPYMREALSSPCFIVKKPGYFFEHFRASHFTAWSSIMALPVPDDLDGIEASLHSYAEHIGRLMELALGPNAPTSAAPKNGGAHKTSQTAVH